MSKIKRTIPSHCPSCREFRLSRPQRVNSWKHFPDERFELNNLITLCENCHMVYHAIYGKGTNKNKLPNTKEQFIEFKRDRNG
jgi:hypothetical protein